MASPTRYSLSYDFVAYQVGSPTVPLPADKIEIEFENLVTTTDEIIDNLNLIQRADGKLNNQVVRYETLAADVKALFNTNIVPRGDWATATAYVVNNLVEVSNIVYVCLVNHTSSALFATDLAADRWQVWANNNLAEYQAAATTATTQAGIATTQAGIATTQAGTATTQAGIATTGAGTATTKAAEAVTSASEALGYRNEAQAAAAGMKRKNPVRAATTAALPANTYANGTAGVGATLTGSSNGALAAQDGITLLLGEGLLVKNEATASRNGLYVVTQVGTAGTPYILTRQTDSDTWNDIVAAVVTVMEGSTQADLDYLCTSNAGGTMGTTNITWQAYNSTIADGAVSTAAKIADNIITFVKMASAAIATSAEIIAGTASKIVTASVLKTAYPRMVVDSAYAEYTTVLTNDTTIIPPDNTIPQITEGLQICSVTISPKTTTNKLQIWAIVPMVAVDNGAPLSIAIFRNGVNDALKSVLEYGMPAAASYNFTPSLVYEFVPGTTSAVTISLRVGGNGGAARFSLNQSHGGRNSPSLFVQEVTS